MKKLIICLLLLCSGSIMAETRFGGNIDLWECKDALGTWDKILVMASANLDTGEGSITAAGKRNIAEYKVDGFNRKWIFGDTDKEGYANYTFLIKPNGDGFYYDFTVSNEKVNERKGVAPSQQFKCRM